ncbi:hypothetical protein BDA96_10G111500 [Sorghum bicolor]|uniref:Uncharacterized protein n=2 Tax=Sorghum bicolor TaxID=4558 RepID=A0A921Q0Z4_SORBI|nr:hypothetical protein BDA96_10G111500 [Sorghum bicolor]OQU76096.1 hypothetical protein SORBI_3010G091366 [Sorghum bicolor]
MVATFPQLASLALLRPRLLAPLCPSYRRVVAANAAARLPNTLPRWCTAVTMLCLPPGHPRGQLFQALLRSRLERQRVRMATSGLAGGSYGTAKLSPAEAGRRHGGTLGMGMHGRQSPCPRQSSRVEDLVPAFATRVALLAGIAPPLSSPRLCSTSAPMSHALLFLLLRFLRPSAHA